jgi:hypothetical protein
MTDNEVNIYNYLLAKEGKGSADEYLGFLVETLNYRQGKADAEALDGNIVGQLLYSIPAGLEQFGSGIRQLFSEERLPTSVAQFTSNAIYEDLADDGPKMPDWLGGGSITQWLYSYGTTMGNMLPSIALTVATGGLGAPAALAQGVGALTMGLSAKGNAYNWALQQGYTKEQAESYSTFVGVSEAGLQYIMGGISAFGGIDADGIVTKLFPKVSNGLLKAGLKLVVKSAGEGVEEYLQTIFEPVYRNMAFGENNEFLLYSDEAMASFFMGVFTAGTIEGGFAIKTGITATKAGGVVMESNNYDTLLQHALALDPETEAYKLANQLSGNKVKASNYNVGTLLMEYVNETGSASFMYTPRPEVKADTNTETDIRLDTAEDIAQSERTLGNAMITLESLGVDTAAVHDAVYGFITASADAKVQAYNNAVDVLNNTIGSAMASMQAAGGDTSGLTALKAQLDSALNGNGIAIQNAVLSIGDLFIDYANSLGTDVMPSFWEFQRIYNEGGVAWDELTQRKNWKEGLQDGAIEPFTSFEEYKTMVDSQGESEYNDSQGELGQIAKIRTINGQRSSKYHLFTQSEIESLIKDIKAIEADLSIFRFNQGYQTGFIDETGIINVRGDILPDIESIHQRDRMSKRAALAHEYYGHKYYNDKFGERNPPKGAWNDEFRASYNAAMNAPNLNNEERMYLMLDALERAKEAGVTIKISEPMKRILYGY